MTLLFHLRLIPHLLCLLRLLKGSSAHSYPDTAAVWLARVSNARPSRSAVSYYVVVAHVTMLNSRNSAVAHMTVPSLKRVFKLELLRHTDKKKQ
jgi:hypothetical protein